MAEIHTTSDATLVVSAPEAAYARAATELRDGQSGRERAPRVALVQRTGHAGKAEAVRTALVADGWTWLP